MASTLLVKDVLWRVAGLLQDTVPQFIRWPEVELVNWLNDAQVAITKYLPAASSRVDVIRLVPGTRQSIESIPAANCKPGDGSTPAQPIYGNQFMKAIRNMGADGLTPGKVVRIVDMDTMDSQSPGWHQTVGTAVGVVVHDPRFPRYFYVFPGVHATTQVWLEVGYTAQPLKIPAGGLEGAEIYKVDGASTETIKIADEYVDDLVDYVVARAYSKDSEYADANKAVAFTNRFLTSLNAKVAAITGNNPNLKRLPLATEPLAAAS
jgi:hypothetical protein